MAISKVVYGANTLIDLTSDTIAAGTSIKGVTSHGADGTSITGTLSRAYAFSKPDGDYGIFVLPVASASVSSHTLTPGSITPSVSGTVLTIGG